jgi:hypothetical protein
LQYKTPGRGALATEEGLRADGAGYLQMPTSLHFLRNWGFPGAGTATRKSGVWLYFSLQSESGSISYKKWKWCHQGLLHSLSTFLFLSFQAALFQLRLGQENTKGGSPTSFPSLGLKRTPIVILHFVYLSSILKLINCTKGETTKNRNTTVLPHPYCFHILHTGRPLRSQPCQKQGFHTQVLRDRGSFTDLVGSKGKQNPREVGRPLSSCPTPLGGVGCGHCSGLFRQRERGDKWQLKLCHWFKDEAKPIIWTLLAFMWVGSSPREE